MVQPQFLRLSPWGLALGTAAAALVAVILRLLTFGFGYGMWGGGPYLHRPYGMGMGGPMHGGFVGFAILAAIAFIVFCAILGAIVAFAYNAAITRDRSTPPSAH